MKAVSMQKIGYLTWKLEMDDGRTAMFCITRPALRLIGDVKIEEVHLSNDGRWIILKKSKWLNISKLLIDEPSSDEWHGVGFGAILFKWGKKHLSHCQWRSRAFLHVWQPKTNVVKLAGADGNIYTMYISEDYLQNMYKDEQDAFPKGFKEAVHCKNRFILYYTEVWFNTENGIDNESSLCPENVMYWAKILGKNTIKIGNSLREISIYNDN